MVVAICGRLRRPPAPDNQRTQQAEEALRATIENTPNVSVQWYDAAGRVLFWNRASEKIFGWDEPEVLGKTLDQFLLTPENAALFQQIIQRIITTGQPEGPVEYEVTRRDGTKGYCVSTAFGISENGQQRVVCMDVDISSQKIAEAALRETSAQLLRVQDEEHRRIARELHDTTAQSLAALTINLAYLQRAKPGDLEQNARVLAESLRLAERSVQEIRTLSYLLHPPELDAMGLPSALREYAAGFMRRSQIETRVDIAPDLRRLPADIELTLFRIVQEALGNILRHAHSPTAHITLNRESEKIILQIRDWGNGIEPTLLEKIRTSPGGLGVGFAGMRERLRPWQGQLEINSSPAGTTLRITIPQPDTHETSPHTAG
jgi:PAS domain S-box-containing protein